MDRQTHAYMADRVKKAGALIKKIEHLVARADRVERLSEMHFCDNTNSNLFSLSARYGDTSENHKRLIEAIKPALRQLIAEEIALLEAELAEL